MRSKFMVPMLVIPVLLMLACSVGYEGVSIGDEQQPENPLEPPQLEATMDAMSAEEPAAATAEPEYQAVAPSASGSVETTFAGSHAYSVAATNYDCTCQATDNMTVDIQFTDNQAEITNAGGETQVYDKIGESKYKRTFMGYYILQEGSGDQATETKVEEENHTVISFTANGYVMESFKGAASSPCCYYTFALEK